LQPYAPDRKWRGILAEAPPPATQVLKLSLSNSSRHDALLNQPIQSRTWPPDNLATTAAADHLFFFSLFNFRFSEGVR
jgi:hypothetical protein